MSDSSNIGQKFAVINTASRLNTLVSAVAGKAIKVLSYSLTMDLGDNIQFRSGSVTNLSGIMSLRNFGGINAHFCPLGLFKTAPGQALSLNVSGANIVSGNLVYVLE